MIRTRSRFLCLACVILIAVEFVSPFAIHIVGGGGGRNILTTGKTPWSPLKMDNFESDDLKRGVSIGSDGQHRIQADVEMDGFCELVDEFGCGALENFCHDGEDGEKSKWIRIEKEPDPSLKNISTKEDIVERIDTVRTDQSRYGSADLYHREWEWECRHQSGISKEFINGEGLASMEKRSAPTISFSVMQFNALAEGLSSGPDDKRPFVDDEHEQREKTGYGGFSSIPFPAATLGFERRKWRLLEVMIGSDGKAPFDVIALEEIDRYRGFFAPVLRIFGYEGLFMPKKKSPCVRMGWYSDGCCLFWKKDTFDLVAERRQDYKVGNQVFIVATLRHRASGKAIVVAVTHLKAQRSESNEKVRCRQVDELLQAIDEEAAKSAMNDSVSTVPTVILGDLNADPPSQIDFKESSIERIMRHRLSEEVRQPGAKRQQYRSAYEIDDPPDTLFTSWKIRGTLTTKRIIDYIFYRGSLSCKATLSVPSADEVEPTKLPGLKWPSDHMMIAAKFDLL